MNEQDNLAVAKKLHSAFVKGDVNLVMELLAEEAEWWFYGPPDIPYTGRFKSREQIINFLNLFGRSVEFIKIIPQEYVNEGDNILVISKTRFKIKPSGKILDTTWVHIFTIKNGKVICAREYPNTTLLTAAFRTKRNPFFAWLF